MNATRGISLKRILRQVAWFLLLGVNVAAPLSLGWMFTEADGRIGMFLGVAVFYATGAWIFWRWPRIADPFLAGSIITALTQFYAVPLFFAGTFAIGIGSALGLGYTAAEDYTEPTFPSTLGGFVVTTITGLLLVAMTTVFALLIRILTPPEWWGHSAGSPKSRSA